MVGFGHKMGFKHLAYESLKTSLMILMNLKINLFTKLVFSLSLISLSI
jgi:hypothetical protein